jgi:hypothetical protein
MVRKERFELSRYCYRQPLKLVRLPVPPLSPGEVCSRPMQAHLCGGCAGRQTLSIRWNRGSGQASAERESAQIPSLVVT